VSGVPRGDGLSYSGEHNLYDAFEMVPPEYHDEFHPNVMVRNWQGIPLEGKREDWIGEEVLEEGRFIPAAVLRAMRRRAHQDPNAVIRRMLGGWRDVVVINDEAHHVYGEKRTRKGEDSEYIKWSKILERVSKAAKLPLVGPEPTHRGATGRLGGDSGCFRHPVRRVPGRETEARADWPVGPEAGLDRVRSEEGEVPCPRPERPLVGSESLAGLVRIGPMRWPRTQSGSPTESHG
jgi:hypothetical protein